MKRIGASGLVCLWAAVLWGAEGTVEFNRDVRPILSDKCYHCHGADAAAKKIPLRLDSEAAAKSVVVAGDPAASEVIRRITADNKAKRMPPVYSGLTLSAREIETLRAWIAQGARWEKHWAFIPPKRHAAPTVSKPEWVRNPIDAFVLARLDKDGLSPSAEASKEVLLRRVTLDLTGLPPTPAEVDAFVKSRSANAYENVVDRLLASPRYGERMAARWLDAARYADTNGYQFDGERVMWRWRDWVIDAFSRNQPYNQFALEQLAGDMLPNATLQQKIATGFNRNHRANTEDGIIPEEYAVEYVVDRLETTSTVFLGVTLGCARCHNHKYDPFTQKEFYQVYAYFNNVPELGRAMKYGNSPPVVAAPTAEQRKQLEDVEARIHRAKALLDNRAASLKPKVDTRPAQWAPEDVDTEFRMEGANFPVDLGGKGNFDIEDRFTISAWVYSDDAPDGSIVSKMVDKPMGKGYGVHLDKGRIHVNLTSNYADDAIRIETEESLAPKRWYHVAMTYTGSRMAEGIAIYVDGKPQKAKVLLDSLYRPFKNAGNVFKEPLRIGGGWGPGRRFKGLIDDVRLYGRVLSPAEIEAISETIEAMAAKADGQRSDVERMVLQSAASEDLRDLWKKLTVLRQEKEKLDRTFPTVMVMAERPQPRETHMLIRGAYDAPGEVVEPGVPAVLPPLPEGAPNNRLGFARWVADERNPLTARVAVNRFWQMYFGTGLVKTVEDFGSQGEWPSHPELLDWLATEFMRTGWDMKGLQKLIVTSATYRQSSRVSKDLVERDPENRLLARGPRNRLPAEMVRDQALAAAGLLAEKVGGPSVKPYQPEGLWKELNMQDMDYLQAKGEDLYRRSLYTFWKRTIAPPMMVTFDSSMRESCVVRETRTNTPLQALNLMNDVAFLEAARFVGQRMLKDGGPGASERLRYGFKLVTGRGPSDVELEVLRGNLQYHLDYFADAAKASAYVKYGDSPADPRLTPRDLAAYGAVCSMLLNLDETVTKE